MRKHVLFAAALAAALLLPAPGAAQTYSSFGVGLQTPIGDMADLYDRGYSLRGQAGFKLLLADVHVQTGYSSYPGKDITIGGVTSKVDDRATYHVGAGTRVGLGFLWVGGNALYFFGDGEKQLGIVPEAGVAFGLLEIVADLRLTGDLKWYGIRAGFRR